MTRKWFNGSDVPAMERPLKLWLLHQAVGPAMDASMQVRAHDAPASVMAGSVLISMQPHRKALLQSPVPRNRKRWTLPCCMQVLERLHQAHCKAGGDHEDPGERGPKVPASA